MTDRATWNPGHFWNPVTHSQICYWLSIKCPGHVEKKSHGLFHLCKNLYYKKGAQVYNNTSAPKTMAPTQALHWVGLYTFLPWATRPPQMGITETRERNPQRGQSLTGGNPPRNCGINHTVKGRFAKLSPPAHIVNHLLHQNSIFSQPLGIHRGTKQTPICYLRH